MYTFQYLHIYSIQRGNLQLKILRGTFFGYLILIQRLNNSTYVEKILHILWAHRQIPCFITWVSLHSILLYSYTLTEI